MYDAIAAGDPTRTLIDIDTWMKAHHGQKAVCPVCATTVRVKADKSIEVNAHFTHEKNSGCPLTAAASKAFELFTKTERTSAVEAMRIKRYALDHIESIYQRAKNICPELLWKEFLSLLEGASLHNIWSFKGFNPGYLPYVLLCCQPIFLGKPKSKRPHSIFFVLEPEASQAEFWHRPAGSKQRIWCVDATNLTCHAVQMTTDEVEPWYRTRAKAILKIPATP